MLFDINSQGTKVKLPLPLLTVSRKGREGKVLGRARTARQRRDDVGSDKEKAGGGEGGDVLVLRAADAAESHGFRALFSAEEDGKLGAGAPFTGQVRAGGRRHSVCCGMRVVAAVPHAVVVRVVGSLF